MKRNVSVVCVCSELNCYDTEHEMKEMQGSVASGKHGTCSNCLANSINKALIYLFNFCKTKARLC